MEDNIDIHNKLKERYEYLTKNNQAVYVYDIDAYRLSKEELIAALSFAYEEIETLNKISDLERKRHDLFNSVKVAHC
jgi:hypothetical protein